MALLGDTPYGECDGENSPACSWRYGWERARESVTDIFQPAARDAGVDPLPSSYRWWLDVETSNTWQDGSDDARGRNRATLEGMVAYLDLRGAEVGLYSTGQQWAQIVGTVPADSPLNGLPSWLAGSVTLTQAVAECLQPPLVPGGQGRPHPVRPRRPRPQPLLRLRAPGPPGSVRRRPWRRHRPATG